MASYLPDTKLVFNENDRHLQLAIARNTMQFWKYLGLMSAEGCYNQKVTALDEVSRSLENAAWPSGTIKSKFPPYPACLTDLSPLKSQVLESLISSYLFHITIQSFSFRSPSAPVDMAAFRDEPSV